MNFALELRRFAEKTNSQMDAVVRNIVVEIGQRVVSRTPVKTGLARGNWQFSVGEPILAPTSKLDPSGGGVAGAIKAGIPVQAAGRVYYLMNNASYILKLEGGSSLQAPKGMVGLTALEFPDIVAKARGSAL